MLYSNVTEAMANQLSNILHKLDIPLDLGLNYQPSDKGTDIFDVAVSTQLFNNRVVVNGNIGNKEYSNGNTQNDVVGDLDIEIKLDRAGAFRLNLFSHSADQYTNYLDNSQRNGVGLMFQTEFNNLGQFFRNIFANKEKRQEARRAEEEAMIEGGKNTIIIDSKK
jgi:flavorubredoxin